MNKEMVVEVACLVDFDDLDHDDRTADGNCAVDGSYGLTLVDTPDDATDDEIIDATSLQFHRHVAIANLDDFEISYRRRSSHDNGMHELGSYPFESEDAPEPA